MKLRTCSESLERVAVIYVTGTKITSMSNLINQLYHASLLFVCTTLFLPCICIYVVSSWAFIAFWKFQSIYVSFANWHINERCNNAGIAVLTWKAKASLHIRRRVRNNTK